MQGKTVVSKSGDKYNKLHGLQWTKYTRNGISQVVIRTIRPNSVVSNIQNITGGTKKSISRYYPEPKIEKPKKW